MEFENTKNTKIENTKYEINLKDFCPTLEKYYTEQNEHNFKKLCLEIQEFCVSIYATIQSEEEKKVYFDMIKKLTLF